MATASCSASQLAASCAAQRCPSTLPLWSGFLATCLGEAHGLVVWQLELKVDGIAVPATRGGVSERAKFDWVLDGILQMKDSAPIPRRKESVTSCHCCRTRRASRGGAIMRYGPVNSTLKISVCSEEREGDNEKLGSFAATARQKLPFSLAVATRPPLLYIRTVFTTVRDILLPDMWSEVVPMSRSISGSLPSAGTGRKTNLKDRPRICRSICGTLNISSAT